MNKSNWLIEYFLTFLVIVLTFYFFNNWVNTHYETKRLQCVPSIFEEAK